MARLALIIASVVMSVSALYGGYGGYGPYGSDVQAVEPVTGMVVMAVEPEPIDMVIPIDVGQTSTLVGCMIDHGFGCEQCMPGFFKVGTAAAPTCDECLFEGCLFCNDFVGCGQCEPDFFLVPGAPEDQAASCEACSADPDAAAIYGCQT